jgi:rhamnosyltransferase|tara:strand:- start:12555 stop:13913 length:1359 start_codon:yes stop_codon:yes gene_type:complete
MNDSIKVSIIIRTKNEEKWIGHCLDAVFSQSYKNFEVIIVDNNSTDATISKAKKFDLKVIYIDKFIPGKAINDGIRSAEGEIFVCLSGHCVPTNNHWLENIVHDLRDPNVAGVYGRQEPLSFTSPKDKRDLYITFGLDKRVQFKDPFFHNANSAFRKDVWDQYNFDEFATNIEDRLWGKKVIDDGYQIVYEPSASVYHWHGLHHDGNKERAAKIGLILDEMHAEDQASVYELPENHEIYQLVLFDPELDYAKCKAILEMTLKSLSASALVSKKFLVTPYKELFALAEEYNFELLLKEMPKTQSYLGRLDVVKNALQAIQQKYDMPDFVIIADETYPLRSAKLVDDFINIAVKNGLDLVVAAKKERRHNIGVLMSEHDGTAADTNLKSNNKHKTVEIALSGLLYLSRPSTMQAAFQLDISQANYVEVTDVASVLQIRSDDELKHIGTLIGNGA